MNSPRLPLGFAVFVVGVALGTVLSAGEGTRGANSGPDELVPLEPYTTFHPARGHSREQVQRQLGPPHHKIYADLWVYWNCESDVAEERARNYDTMIITFTNGCVSSVRLAPRAVVETLIARVKAAKEAASNTVVARHSP